jgi:tRNA threonylcarbamoyladenosine biosynthesis protein TsaB
LYFTNRPAPVWFAERSIGTLSTVSTPVILSLETATMAGSVWLGAGDVELTSRTGDAAVSQSTSLLRDINEVLGEAGVKLADVDFFCCAAGPGSFTGLRIGIATLKALASSLQRPCIGIPTLAAVAHAGGTSAATVALLPAGRGEVFVQMFSVSPEGVVRELDAAAHLSPKRLLERYSGIRRIKWAGAGAQAQRELIERAAKEAGLSFLQAALDPIPDASAAEFLELAADEANLARHVAALALQAFAADRLQSADSLRAIYVRPSDAELNQNVHP